VGIIPNRSIGFTLALLKSSRIEPIGPSGLLTRSVFPTFPLRGSKKRCRRSALPPHYKSQPIQLPVLAVSAAAIPVAIPVAISVSAATVSISTPALATTTAAATVTTSRGAVLRRCGTNFGGRPLFKGARRGDGFRVHWRLGTKVLVIVPVRLLLRRSKGTSRGFLPRSWSHLLGLEVSRLSRHHIPLLLLLLLDSLLLQLLLYHLPLLLGVIAPLVNVGAVNRGSSWILRGRHRLLGPHRRGYGALIIPAIRLIGRLRLRVLTASHGEGWSLRWIVIIASWSDTILPAGLIRPAHD
jgi:hypothetical protein